MRREDRRREFCGEWLGQPSNKASVETNRFSERATHTDGVLTESLLIITGTMGAGKTAVLGEASDILAQRRIVHAAIDLDVVGLSYLPSGARSDGVMYENLRAISGNYADLGVQRFLVARAIDDAAQLSLCRELIPAANTVVCRLTASAETAKRRVEARESGILRRDYVLRAAELTAILDRAQMEDFVVVNENRPLTDVALEMLLKARWISN